MPVIIPGSLFCFLYWALDIPVIKGTICGVGELYQVVKPRRMWALGLSSVPVLLSVD